MVQTRSQKKEQHPVVSSPIVIINCHVPYKHFYEIHNDIQRIEDSIGIEKASIAHSFFKKLFQNKDSLGLFDSSRFLKACVNRITTFVEEYPLLFTEILMPLLNIIYTKAQAVVVAAAAAPKEDAPIVEKEWTVEQLLCMTLCKNAEVDSSVYQSFIRALHIPETEIINSKLYVHFAHILLTIIEHYE